MQDIAYCMNVHPANNLKELYDNFNKFALPIFKEVQTSTQKNIGVELHLNHVVSEELAKQIEPFNQFIEKNDINIFSINNFPLIDFHQPIVKDKVYLPSWAQSERLEQTKLCAKILSQLKTNNTELTISTLAGSWKYHNHDENSVLNNYMQIIRYLQDLHEQTGKKIRVALEPEPDTTLDSLASIIAFFDKLKERLIRSNMPVEKSLEYIGLNFDTCHSSVLFEKPLSVILELLKKQIPIYKFHITNAPKLLAPFSKENKISLKSLDEPKYLHQTRCKMPDEKIVAFKDLCHFNSEEVQEAQEIRTHFHVPLNLKSIGLLETTQSEVKDLLDQMPTSLSNTPLVVETYTWPQHLNATKQNNFNLIDGISQELIWLAQTLENK